MGRAARSVAPWAAPVLVLLASTATVALHIANSDLDAGSVGTEYWLANVLDGLAWSVPGALIAHARPRLPFGWILCGLGLAHAGTALLLEVAVATQAPPALPTLSGRVAYWGASWLWVVVPASVPVLLLLFPTGSLGSRPWRPALGFAVTSALVLVGGIAFEPGPIAHDNPGTLLAGLINPFGLDVAANVVDVANVIGFPLQALAAFVALGSLVARSRSAEGEVHEQVRWLALGAATSVAMTIGAAVLPLPAGLDAPLIILPITTAITIALIRHRLFAIDRLVRRSVAYAALVVVLAAVYVVVVAGGVALIGADARTAVGAVAAIAVAAVFVPLRDRLRSGVDRLFYGGRADPYEVMAGVGRRLGRVEDPSAVLPRVVAEVADALRLPWVGIEVAGGDIVTSGGDPVGPVEAVELAHHGTQVGHLLVCPRSGDDRMHGDDLAVLTDLAPQVAAAVHAVGLTNALRASRERLVSTREEERRRLRRDLHDGLGPALTGVSMRAEAAAILMHADPAAAARELEQVSADLGDALAEVRRLVDGLRPADLDQLGLVGAVRAEAQRLGPRIRVDAADLGALPAAVEVAAYRIVVEALTNIRRHAHASQCEVRLRRPSDLEIDIVDDGIGLHQQRVGAVGLEFIRERAEELGGTCSLEPSPGGGPASRGATSDRGSAVNDPPDDAGGHPKVSVAIAEDHPVMRGGLRALLSANGMDVVAEADNGADIVDLVARLTPDVVLMDLEMPGMDGVAATSALVRRDPDCRVLVLTMHADDETVFNALRAGARGYLVKGSAPHHVVRAVRAVAEGQIVFDTALADRVLDQLRSPRPREEAFPGLTSREREVFALLAKGLNNRAIAQRLGVSTKTVANHVSNVFAKLHLADRAEAIIRARDSGLADT